MSDTPITDAEAYDYETGRRWLDGVVSAHIVRKLERENAALRADKEELIQALHEAEQNMARCLDEGKLPAWSIDCLRAAINAARKEQPKWPTLEGRLANKLTSTEEAITQLKNTVEISPIANKILEANK